MANRKFKSSFNSWNTVLIVGLLFLFIVQAICFGGSLRYTNVAYSIVCIFMIVHLYYNVYYEIHPDHIYAKSSFHTKKIAFSDIRTIRTFEGDPLKFFSSSLGYGRNGLVIWLRSNYQVYISPKEKAEFLAALQAAYPNVVVESSSAELVP